MAGNISDSARDRLIRTIIAEAGGEGPAGWAAVAHVIKNRADSGKFGKQNSISEVLNPSQFAALNPNSPAYHLFAGADPNGPMYQRVGALVDGVLDGSIADTTGGADHYYAPKGMRDRQAPEWASKAQNSTTIGNQVFLRLGEGNVPAESNIGASPTGVGNVALGNREKGAGVDPRLVEILDAAAQKFPGYTVRISSGKREGDPRFHGRGMATDVELIDPDGKVVPNYQNAGAFSVYEKFAQEARRAQQALHPDLDQAFRWGGYFSGPKGKYGAADLMHFDLGGSKGLGMAGGSWEGGLTAAQRSLFPGATSAGMGGVDYAGDGRGSYASPVVQKASANAADLPWGTRIANALGMGGQAAGTPVVRNPAQGSHSDWIMPDAKGRIGVAAPKIAKPAAGAGTGGAGAGTSQALPPARPTSGIGLDRPAGLTVPGGTPLPPSRPTEPGGTPLDLFEKPSMPGGTPLQPYRPTEPGGTPLDLFNRPTEAGGTPLQPFRPTEPGGTPLAPYRPTEPGGTFVPSDPGGVALNPTAPVKASMVPALPPQPPPTAQLPPSALLRPTQMMRTPPYVQNSPQGAVDNAAALERSMRPASLPPVAPQQSWWQTLFGG